MNPSLEVDVGSAPEVDVGSAPCMNEPKRAVVPGS